MVKREKIVAVILAAGRGTRMESDIRKQYMELDGYPLIYYSLAAFENSPVDQVVLVTGQGEEAYCRSAIVERYGFSKITAVVPGGEKRYYSVYEGLKAAADSDWILIHDGARPCITGTIIQAAIDGVRQYQACVVGMPVKDTIKISDEEGFAQTAPDRRSLWAVQTPQAFAYPLVMRAYRRLFQDERRQIGITDDAMVVEAMTAQKVRLIPGSYENIKVTTPEDMEIAKLFLRKEKRRTV